MAFYVVYDAAGSVVTRYDSVINAAQIANPPVGLSLLEVPDQATMLQTMEPGWTVVNGSLVRPPLPTTAELLSQAKSAQNPVLIASYQASLNTPVPFTNSAGITSTYAFGNSLTPWGSNAQSLLSQIISAGSSAWKAGVWFDTKGVAQTMTFTDLQNLAVAIEAAQTLDEQDLMAKMAEVQAATTVSAVQAITF